MALSVDELQLALKAIALWREDADASPDCPQCGKAGLAIVDQSARPYTEWYHLACRDCGLDETVHIPLGPPVLGSYD